MKFLPPFVSNLFTFWCIILCTQSCSSFTSKKVSGVKPNQDAIAAAPAFGSLDGDASRTKQFENIQTNAVQDGDLFKQYKNKTGGSRYRWYYSKSKRPFVSHTRTPYKPIKNRILLEAQQEALSEIKTEIKSVLIDEQVAINDFYKSFTKSQIESRVSGILRSEYWQSESHPPEHKMKAGDLIEVVGRFDQVAYRERLESDKRKNEKLAKNSFERAHESYAKGHLYKCLEDMALCHYYIYNGGKLHVFDPIEDRKIPVIEALFNLANEIKQGIGVDVLDKDGYVKDNKKVEFIKSDNLKFLPLQIGYFTEPKQDLGGVRIKLVDTSDGQEEFVNIGDTYKGESYKIDFEISDFLKGNKSLSEWYVSFDISANLGPEAEGVNDWRSSDSYNSFLRTLLYEKILIEDVTLPPQKIIFIHDLCIQCEPMSEYPGLVENQLKQLGREYFIDMLGVDDITRTVKKEIELAYKHERKIKDQYGLDGVMIIEFHRESTLDEMVIKYFTIDNLIQPKMESREKAPGVNNMGEKILEQGVKKFFDNYLYRNISFENGTKNVELRVEKIVNNQPVEGSLQIFRHKGKAWYRDQGRYSDLKFRFSANGFRTQEIEVRALEFDYSNVFPRLPITNELVSSTQKIELKKAQGIADIIIETDNWPMLNNESTLSNVEIKIRKKGFTPFLKKWDDPIIGKLNYRYENSTGDYLVKISAPGFQKQSEVPFEIIDGEISSYDIELKYKSKLRAFVWSSLLPGTGHMYMQKGKLRNNILPLGLYGLSLGAAIKYNDSYQRHRSDFLTYQDEFKVSPDRETSDENRRMAQKSWNQMEDAKNYFIGMAASAVLTNLVTSIMLMFTS